MLGRNDLIDLRLKWDKVLTQERFEVAIAGNRDVRYLRYGKWRGNWFVRLRLVQGQVQERLGCHLP